MNEDMNNSMPMDDMPMGDMAGHEMMMDMGPVVFGNIHLINLLMMVSGLFYLICAVSIWKTWRREKNELVGALFAFLCYQAVSMFFMGLSMQTMAMWQMNVAGLAIFVGSAYMLKFPLSRFSQGVRRISFLVVLIALLGLFTWFMQTPEKQTELSHFVLWYDLIVNGLLVGGSIIVFGVKSAEKLFRRKAIGGGTGVVSCCVVATGAMIGGYMLAGTIFSFLAPILILSVLKQRAMAGQPSPAAPVGSAANM